MSGPILGGPYLSKEQQDINRANDPEKMFGAISAPGVKEARRKQIIEKYQNIIDDKEIQKLEFETPREYYNWFRENIINVLDTNEYDSEDPRISPLYIAIRIRYYHKLSEKKIPFGRIDKQKLIDNIQNLQKDKLDELKQKLQDDGYDMNDEFIKSLFGGKLQGGSRRKQSKRRMRKTQHRRKRNNRKSKKSKQV